MKDNFNEKDVLSKREAGGFFVIFLGILILISSILINPWIGKLWRANIIDFYNAMLEYFVWSSILGILILTLGLLVLKKRKKIIDNLTVLFAIISILFLSDRLLLVKFGVSLVVIDPKTLYRYRPNAVRRWGSGHPNPDKIIRINKYGFHDDNFPIKKPVDELRGITVGNSITMGFGIISSETYSNQLENLLERYDKKYNSYQIINAGVQGYSIYQEYQMLKESMKFKPDFVTIGFCMNDVYSTPVMNRLLGKKEIEEYGIMKTTNPILSYLLNETGYGRLFIMLRREIKLKKSQKIREELTKEYYSWLTYSKKGANIEEAWGNVLSDLEEFYKFTKKNNLQCILLIFPDFYQLFNKKVQRPQKVLIEHAEKYNVDFIDFTKVFESFISKNIKDIVSYEKKETTEDEVQKLYSEELEKYFIDGQHPSPEGHKIIALKLLEYLHNKGLIKLIIKGGKKSG